MTMTDDFNNNIAELRAAAALYEWYECDAAVRGLLECFSLQEVIEIAVRQLTACLPVFEQSYPGVTWPREGLARAARFEPADYVVYSSRNGAGIVDAEDRREPDANAFMDAIRLLDDAYVAYRNNEHETCLRLAAGAIGNAIIAKVHSRCAEEYPEFWKAFVPRLREIKQLSDTTAQTEAAHRLYQEYDLLMGDYHQSLWLKVADELERGYRQKR